MITSRGLAVHSATCQRTYFCMLLSTYARWPMHSWAWAKCPWIHWLAKTSLLPVALLAFPCSTAVSQFLSLKEPSFPADHSVTNTDTCWLYSHLPACPAGLRSWDSPPPANSGVPQAAGLPRQWGGWSTKRKGGVSNPAGVWRTWQAQETN